jgi:hypothetical protein
LEKKYTDLSRDDKNSGKHAKIKTEDIEENGPEIASVFAEFLRKLTTK